MSCQNSYSSLFSPDRLKNLLALIKHDSPWTIYILLFNIFIIGKIVDIKFNTTCVVTLFYFYFYLLYFSIL